ncbi:hypothetical protein NTE17_004120 [Vibrio fluvialis]|nr:hypothetical protein [Vibrio fluvialis]
MEITVIRDACCGQDDQCGNLTMQLVLDSTSTIMDLAKAVGEANFLQFTSTHNVIFAHSGSAALFSIPAKTFDAPQVEYLVPKSDLILEHIVEDYLYFKWDISI